MDVNQSGKIDVVRYAVYDEEDRLRGFITRTSDGWEASPISHTGTIAQFSSVPAASKWILDQVNVHPAVVVD